MTATTPQQPVEEPEMLPVTQPPEAPNQYWEPFVLAKLEPVPGPVSGSMFSHRPGDI